MNFFSKMWILSFLVVLPTFSTTTLPFPRIEIVSPSLTSLAGLVAVSQLTATFSPLIKSAVLLLDMPNPALATESSLRTQPWSLFLLPSALKCQAHQGLQYQFQRGRCPLSSNLSLYNLQYLLIQPQSKIFSYKNISNFSLLIPNPINEPK